MALFLCRIWNPRHNYSFEYSEILIIFASLLNAEPRQAVLSEAESWAPGTTQDIVEKAFTNASHLDQLKSGSFKIFIKTEATVDVHEYVITNWCEIPRGMQHQIRLHICVGSARCSSYEDGHMPEPRLVGRATVRYPRFFMYLSGPGYHPDTQKLS